MNFIEIAMFLSIVLPFIALIGYFAYDVVKDYYKPTV